MTSLLIVTEGTDDRCTYSAEHDAALRAVIDELDERGGVTTTSIGAVLSVDPTPGSAFDPGRQRAIDVCVDGTSADGAALRRVVDNADAVLIAGCNLGDSSPHLLFERGAVAQLAAARSLPVVLADSSFGSRLTEGQRSFLAQSLSAAAAVSVLDDDSRQIATSVGLTAPVQLHDGAFLRGTPVETELPAHYVALVLHAFPDAAETGPLQSLVAFVRDIHRISALPVVVFPTTGAIEGPSDSAADIGIVGLLTDAVADPAVLVAAPLMPARELATACRQAAAVVSSRALPVALAVAGAVPVLALTAEATSHAPLAAALGHGGLQSWRVPVGALAGGAGSSRFEELWARRDEITAHLTALRPALLAAHRQRWDGVHAVLTGGRPASPSTPDAPEALLSNTDLTRFEQLDELHRTRLTRLQDAFDGAEQYAVSLRELLEHRDGEIDDLRARVLELEGALSENFAEQTRLADEASDSRQAAQAAQRLAAALAEWRTTEADASRIALIEQHAAAVQREIDALNATLLFRTMRLPRRAYGRLRRGLRKNA